MDDIRLKGADKVMEDKDLTVDTCCGVLFEFHNGRVSHGHNLEMESSTAQLGAVQLLTL
jgi:hypothetical protein